MNNYIVVRAYCVSKSSCCCRYPDHEQSVGKIAKEMGFNHVSLSSLVMPMVRIVPRGFTGTCTCMACTRYRLVMAVVTRFEHFAACADAYLTPCIERYVRGFASGFKDPVCTM